MQSFEWAREFCPNAVLILNDYNIIEYAEDNARFLDIVERIVAAGAPVDALGAQAHDAYRRSNAELSGFLEALTATGLPLYITEYDVNLPGDAEQLEVMRRQFPLFWENPEIAGVTLWGYVTGATWQEDAWLISEAGVERPAMSWLLQYLGR